MVLSLVSQKPSLSLVAAPAPTSAEAFYDATIPEAWRLARALYGGDDIRAADATVRAYSEVWHAGSPDRTALLAVLVSSAPSHHPRGTATVVPLTPRRRSFLSPTPPVPA